MIRRTKHARILVFPYADSLSSARLDALTEEFHGKRRDLILDYHELDLVEPPEMFSLDGQPCERVQGEYVPRRLWSIDLQWIKRTGSDWALASTTDVSLSEE